MSKKNSRKGRTSQYNFLLKEERNRDEFKKNLQKKREEKMRNQQQ